MKHFYFLLIISFLTSCGSMYNTTIPHYAVEVDAYGDDSTLSSKKYILASGDSAINENNSLPLVSERGVDGLAFVTQKTQKPN